jgi:hypothetical protein
VRRGNGRWFISNHHIDLTDPFPSSLSSPLVVTTLCGRCVSERALPGMLYVVSLPSPRTIDRAPFPFYPSFRRCMSCFRSSVQCSRGVHVATKRAPFSDGHLRAFLRRESLVCFERDRSNSSAPLYAVYAAKLCHGCDACLPLERLPRISVVAVSMMRYDLAGMLTGMLTVL